VTTPDVLEAAKPFMQQCGPHDYGLHEMGCMCPDGDPRVVISRMFQEIQRLRDRLDAAQWIADENRRMEQKLAAIRALAGSARSAGGIGCLASDLSAVCDGSCGGHRTTGWTLDPAEVLRALDGES
jgi:hypothetical protein